MTLPIARFTADRTFDGRIRLFWHENEPGTTIKIVKKLRDYPYDITDGDLIYAGPSTPKAVYDATVSDSVWYYYQLYFWDTSLATPNYNTDVTLRSYALAIKPIGFNKILANQSPNMYKAEESAVSPNDPFSWQTIRDEIFALLFEDVAGLIRALPKTIDVDDCPANALLGLARLVGIDPNQEMPILRQREEIKAAIDVWKTKGTSGSIVRAVKAVTGLDTEIDEWVDNIIITNRADRLNVDFSDASEMENYRRYGHKTCHVLDFNTVDWDSWYNTFSLGVYIYFTDEAESLTQEATRKIRRIVLDFIPVFQQLHIFFESIFEHDEVYPYYPVVETNIDSIRDRAEDVYGFTLPLLANRTARRSNSLTYRSARSGVQKIAKDTWFDIVNTKS